MDKISVITVVYNDARHIRATVESYLRQTWPHKEYIVIDGGSTDGTKEILEEYANQLAYFCSEPDEGLYDAMNKGLRQATGDWINILNSGDYFATDHALADMMQAPAATTADVLYADSLQRTDNIPKRIQAHPDPSRLRFAPCYRHGSSLVRRSVHLQYPFDTSRQKELRYALDWDIIYRMYRDGKQFAKVDTLLQSFDTEGESNHPYLTHWLNYKVRRRRRFDFPRWLYALRSIVLLALHDNPIYPWVRGFAVEYMVNDVLPHVPFWTWRRGYLRRLGMQIGEGSFLMKRNYFMYPWLMRVGAHTHINRGCTLDARGGLIIGNNVSISHEVALFTGSHDAQSTQFQAQFAPIQIDDYAWLGARCTVLQGLHIGEGAVVCAGAVVTHDVQPYTIVAGIPAKVIGTRQQLLDYRCEGYSEWT